MVKLVSEDHLKVYVDGKLTTIAEVRAQIISLRKVVEKRELIEHNKPILLKLRDANFALQSNEMLDVLPDEDKSKPVLNTLKRAGLVGIVKYAKDTYYMLTEKGLNELMKVMEPE